MNDVKYTNTFIIPTLNNVSGLIKCVESIYKHTPDNFRVIVVFNGLHGDYEKARLALGKKVHIWLRPHKNLGFGKSMNLGIRLAETEYVTLANDDVEVIDPRWWLDILQIFSEHKNLGGFNPHSFINKRSSGQRVAQYEIKDEYSQEDIEAMKKVFSGQRWYTGVCTFFTVCKKEMFDKIGLFDESFGLGSGEDYDLCVRAARGGYLIAGGSRVMVKHWWGSTKDNLPKDDPELVSNFDLIYKGNQHMERKWGPHCQELRRRIESGSITEEEADKFKGGWDVAGNGGPVMPLDANEGVYKKIGEWWQSVDL